MYHFDTKQTTILKFPWAPYNANGDYYDYEYNSSNTAAFSSDDSHFVVSLTSNNEEFTVVLLLSSFSLYPPFANSKQIYGMRDFKITQVLPATSKAIAFVPNQPNVFIRLTNNSIEVSYKLYLFRLPIYK
jgi:hypothetical protein